jgi:hypothetical protein
MMQNNTAIARVIAAITAICLLSGCTGSRNAAETEAFFETPGRFVIRPANAARPRVGIPAPAIEAIDGVTPGDHLQVQAADQLFWVIDRSARFNLVERSRVAELMSHSTASETLKPGELLHSVALQGIDYLLLCRISRLSVRGETKPEKVSVENVERLLRIAARKPRLTTSAAVQLKLVNPATGVTAADIENVFRRSCSPEAMGLNFTDPDDAWGKLHLTDEQAQQVMRIVLDDAVRKFLPKVDLLLTRSSDVKIASATTGPATHPSRGFEATTDDQFCPNCGARLIAKTSTAPQLPASK